MTTQTTTAPKTTKTVRRPRPAAKTGNPAADRTVQQAAAKSSPKAAPKAAKPTPAKPATPKATPEREPLGAASMRATAAKANGNGDAKAIKRAAKQEIARRAVQAVADAMAGEDASTKQDAANWIHHLPTGNVNGAGSARWWPANLPRPDRSDWR
jgi:hypothetical protein